MNKQENLSNFPEDTYDSGANEEVKSSSETILSNPSLRLYFVQACQVLIRRSPFKARILLLISSLILFISCGGKNAAGYTEIQIEESWKRSLQILKVVPREWESIQTRQLDFDALQELAETQEGDLYKKSLEYSPLSMVENQWKNQNDSHFRSLIFEMSTPLDAFGAYSRLRNPEAPAYQDALFIPPSEGVYLPGRLIVYRGHHLWLIDHDIEQLSFLRRLTKTMLKEVPNKEFSGDLISLLPKGQLIPRSVSYVKKSLLNLKHLNECAIGKYEPQSSMQIFICDMDEPNKAKDSFKRHHEYVEKELALGSPQQKKKEFKRAQKKIKVDHFFYDSPSYELHGIFYFKKFIFGIIGSSSQSFTFALANEILDKLDSDQGNG